MTQVPDTRGMTMRAAVAILTAAGFVAMTDDPIEETLNPADWAGGIEPRWGRIHSQHILGGDHPNGTVVPIRVVIRMGERDYGRTKWADFDQEAHELSHGRPAPEPEPEEDVVSFESSDGNPIEIGTVVALGVMVAKRAPDISSHSHIHPATKADDPRQVIGVVIKTAAGLDPMHDVATLGPQNVRADSTLSPGEWGWVEEPGVLSRHDDGWYIIDRLDSGLVVAYVGRHVPQV